MINLLIYFFYRPLYALIKLSLPFWRSNLDEKTKQWMALRETKIDFDYGQNENVFWFHASSGEIEYAKAIIRELKSVNPSAVIVVSYSSPSAIRLFENIKTHVSHFVPLPWDQKKPLQGLIKAIHPKAIIIARTDLWPELIFQLKQLNIPSFIASYNPSLTFGNRIFNAIFLKHFQGLFCVHPTQASILNSILPKSVAISAPGDTRFDQVFWRLAQPSKITIPLDFNYAVLGSTWIEDEKIVIPMLSEIASYGQKIFWCPHEINTKNIERIELWLLELQLSHKKYSEIADGQAAINDLQVILVDQIGVLADLYRQANWAFVGGSFKDKVHSVMEPLCCAIPVITGPKINNSPEALRYHQVLMNDLRIVQVVNDSKEFQTAVLNFKNIQIKDFKKMLIGHLEQNRYASIKIVHLILNKLQEKVSS